jgi:cytochrome c oxidase subunit IV
MAHHEHVQHPDHPETDAMGVEVHHPTWKTYVYVGLFLTIITAVEVSAFYIPAWEQSWFYVPSMLVMSGVKFATVVLFYMHLRYDHRLFKALFTGPLIIAMATIVALLFLFGKFAVRTGVAV